VTDAVTNKAQAEIRIGSFLLYLWPLCLLLNSYGCTCPHTWREIVYMLV